MEPIEGVWRTETSSFVNFHRDVNDNFLKWDLKPKHQRDVIHTDKWCADIIRSAIMFKDIPEVYFFTRTNQDGLDYYVSLDGKQRCMAILKYMDDAYPYYPEFPASMHGKKFNELSPLDQQRIRESKITMKILSSDMTDVQIDMFFNDRQKTQQTSLGEYINAGLQYTSRTYFVDALGSALFAPLFKNMFPKGDPRYRSLEVLTHMGYIYTHPDSEIDPTTEEILEWWGDDPFNGLHLLEGFYLKVRDTMNFLISLKVKRKDANSVFKPFFKMVLNRPDLLPVLRTIISEGRLPAFPIVGGSHTYTHKRYNFLIEVCEAK